MKDYTIDLVKSKSFHLPKHRDYHVTIVDACIICKLIKICFEFEDCDTQERFYLVDCYTIGTKKYNRLIKDIYCGDDNDVIAVNLSDFFRFSASCSGDAVKDGQIMWKKLDFIATPLSFLWMRKHEAD